MIDVPFAAIVLLATAAPAIPADPPLPLDLAPTRQIDSDQAKVKTLARQLTQGAADERQAAVAIHNWVRDQILFGWRGDAYLGKASETIRARRGYGPTKTTVFIALLRAAGIPARPRFVDVDTKVLEGAIDPRTPKVDHSFAEVWLDGRWIALDSYTVDLPLAIAARAQLRKSGKSCGWGIAISGSSEWDGRTDSFIQWVPALRDTPLPSRDFGRYADAEEFYARNPDAWNPLVPAIRWLFPRFAQAGNERVDRLRNQGAAPKN